MQYQEYLKADEYVANAKNTIEEKYRKIRVDLRRLISGSSEKKHYLLTGDADIGKSCIVKDELERINYKNVPVACYVGCSIGAELAVFLWQNRDREVVVFDDCDFMIQSKAESVILNMLNAAINPDRPHVSILPAIQKDANSLLRSLNKNTENESEEIPSGWDFNAKVIFVSGLTADKVNPELLLRCDRYELHLTNEEYMVRLGAVIKNMDCGQGRLYDEADIEEAKALLMTALSSLIAAEKNGIKMFGEIVRLKQGGWGFSMVQDLIENYMGLVEDYQIDHPDTPKDEVKKLVIPEWTRACIIPHVSV